MEVANETGHVAERPMESERPATHLREHEGVLMRVVAQDFVRRVVVDGAETDYLLYLYFPGRSLQTADTHARLRSRFMKLAEFLDAPASNGSLAVGWMDCLYNQIPPPHGTHIHADTLALYPARSKGTPLYYLDLRGGDVELPELIDFVESASANEATRRHVAARREEAGPRVVHEGLEASAVSFRDSLVLDERQLRPENLTLLRERMGESAKDEL